jgi:fatty acid desaturase
MVPTTNDRAEVVGEEFRDRDRAGLAPEVLRRLTVLSPWRATLSLVATWGLIGALIAAAVLVPHPLVVVVALVGIAGQQHGLAILAHQSAHYRMYRARWLNDLVGRLCGIPLGVSMLTYRVIHRIHHNHLYEPIDPDLPLMAGYPRGRGYLLRKLGKDLLGLTTLKNYTYFLGKPGPSSAPKDDTSPALRRAAGRDRRLILYAHLVLWAVLIATGAFGTYLLLWFLPLVTLLQMLLRLRAVCEHGAPTALDTPLRAARTTLAPFWIRWLLFPHHMNYHVEHHLYPAVPHYRLAECHRELVRAGALQGAEVVPRLGHTLAKVFADAQA